MSTKTLRKRIALVAVSAMGFGLLTSVTANAALGAGSGALAGQLYVATTASSTGSAAVSSTGAVSVSTNVSVGWIAETTSTAATSVTQGLSITSGAAVTAHTATVYPGAQIPVIATNITDNDGVGIVVTGGVLSSVGAAKNSAAVTTAVVAGNAATAVVPAVSGSNQLTGIFTVNAAAGSTATITAYSGTSIAGLTTATSGTLIGTWTLTVVASSAAGTYSAANSTIAQQACNAISGSATLTTNSYDTTTRCDNTQVGSVYVQLVDAYGSAITASTNTLYASATNGSKVKILTSTSYSSTGYSATAAFDSTTSYSATGQVWIVVTQPVASVAGTSVVSISLNGTNIGSKTINWNGDAASITVDTANSAGSFQAGTTAANAGSNSNTYYQNVIYVIKDAAGNAIKWTSQPTVDSATGALIGASLSSTGTSTTDAVQTVARGYGYATMLTPSDTLYGAASYRLKITNSAGVSIYSPVVQATVSNGSTDKFEVTWDKTSYKPGDLAKLTIKAMDSKGNLMADGTALAGLTLSVASGFTAVGTACSATSVTVSGEVSCKYAAGNTAGSYSYSIDLTTSPDAQAASVGALGIATSEVSNAAVLEAIVKLIASINKQIAALQKALKKK